MDSRTSQQETPATLGSTTTSVPYATVPEEAYCAGFLYGLETFSREIVNEEFNRLFGDYDLSTCMRDATSRVDEWRTAAGDDRYDSLKNWFVTGCIGPALTYTDELVQNDPVLDGQFAETVALEACWTPFIIATDLQVEAEIRADHVCCHLAFEPTAEQMETGLIPCP